MLKYLSTLLMFYSVVRSATISLKNADSNLIYTFKSEEMVFFTKHKFQFNVPEQQLHKITVLDTSNINTLATGTNNINECLIINFLISDILKLRKILKHNTNNVTTVIFVFKDIGHFMQIQHSIRFLRLSSQKQVFFVHTTTNLANLTSTHFVTIDYSFDVSLPVRINYNVHPLTEFIKEDKDTKSSFYAKHYSQIGLFFALTNITNQGDSDHFISQIIIQYSHADVEPHGDKAILQNENLFSESRNVDNQIQRTKTFYRKERFKLDLSPVLFTRQDFLKKFGADIDAQIVQIYYLNCRKLDDVRFNVEFCSTTTHLESTLAWKVIDECLNNSPTLQKATQFNLNVFKLKLYTYITDNYKIEQQESISKNFENWTNDILKYLKYLNHTTNNFNAQTAYEEVKKCTDDANTEFINQINSRYKSIFSYINMFNVFSVESLNFATHEDFWHSYNKVNQYTVDYLLGRGMVNMDLPREVCGIKMGESNSEYCDYLNRLENGEVIDSSGGAVWKKVLEIALVLILILFVGLIVYLKYVNSKLIRTTYRYVQMKTNRDSNVDLEENSEVYK
eukprot:GAHX01001988.1.p1 GENE.GAHX01001988.1~~GAHX01001988.1.p1  ORF type:complete len:565 (-),score=98.85 GAHX01001988.1:26-1720(-)